MILDIMMEFIHYMYQKKSNEQVLNVLLITNEGKSHYVFIKDFNRLMYSKTRNTNKKHFCMSCLQNFSAEEILNIMEKDVY